MHLLLKKDHIINQTKFNKLSKLKRQTQKKYEPIFFEERYRLQKYDLTAWCNFHRIYAEFLDYWVPILFCGTSDDCTVKYSSRRNKEY